MSDPDFNSVVLLMHCDTLVDEISGQTATATGDAAVSTAQKKFGSGSILFDGTGDTVTLPDSPDWDFGTAPFTIELWARWTSVPTYAGLLWHSGDWMLRHYEGALQFWAEGNVGGAHTWTPTTDTWYAIAVDRDGSNVLRTYIDGVMAGKSTSYTHNINGSTAVLTLGFYQGTFSNYFPGYLDEIRITKGVARYGSDSGYTPSTTGFPFYPVATTDTVQISQGDTQNLKLAGSTTEGVGVAESVIMGQQFTDALSEILGLEQTQLIAIGAELADTAEVAQTQLTGFYVSASDVARVSVSRIAAARRVIQTLTDTTSFTEVTKLNIGQVLREAIRLATSALPAIKFSAALADLTRIAESLSRGQPVSLAETVGVAQALRLVTGVHTLERLGLTELVAPVTRYKVATVEQVALRDALARFFGVNLAETLGVASTASGPVTKGGILADTVGIASTLTPRLILRVTAAEGIAVSAVQALRMVFRPVVEEDVEISAGYVSPDGSFTAWVVNTRTGATTEYRNYEFNSFAQHGHKYLGASSTGLYELNGDDDNGDDIIAQIKSGFAQFAGSRHTSFKGAYLGLRADGDVLLKIEAGDGATYTYQVVVQNMQTTKVRMGKGLRARYFAFELISTGQDFTLDSIEFVPIMAQRRV